MLSLVKPIILRPLTVDGQYEHMAKRDAAVWNRWLVLHAAEWDGVAYDVALGGLGPPMEETDPTFERMWQYQTALKIDAFLVRSDRARVVEVRPWATVSALGAAVCYAMVLERTGVSNVPTETAIVCEGIQVDVRWCAETMGIIVDEV